MKGFYIFDNRLTCLCGYPATCPIHRDKTKISQYSTFEEIQLIFKKSIADILNKAKN